MNLFDLLCPPVFAHTGAVPVTVSAAVWWEWRMEWGLLAILIFTLVGYLRLIRAAAAVEGQVLSKGHLLRFAAGLLLLYVAAASPIDRIGEEYLFSMHMVQHNLFMYVVARLLLGGIPPWAAQHWYERLPRFQRLYRIISHPILACLAFNLTFTLWHIPFLYDWALRDRMVHNLEHLTMIATALMLWLPLWSPLRDQRPAYPMQMFYLIAVAIAQLPVFAYVTFSPVVLYPTYEMAPRLTMLSAAADQQLGGVLMKINGMLVLFGAFIGVAMEWYNSEQSADLAERKLQDPTAVPRPGIQAT
ncbi:MAG: cytochrome c oxidase assembly protein [Candidatus Melainabacteria bacterium HGW-Melainabacteria-1]|nr:MAG: cytochrome c oxidase assembly protein [Candidatus Melainabacteria bacterium HGW-Melainabacteria-1]